MNHNLKSIENTYTYKFYARVMKYHPRSGVVIAGLAILMISLLFIMAGCDNNDDIPIPIPTITTEPSREDIIEAVRRSVEGKSYTVTSTRWEQVVHTCSQMDVEFDPYMPHNPELARCPYAGKTYTSSEPVNVSEVQNCKSLPGPDLGWTIEEISDDTWRVSLYADTWKVEKVDGASANAGDYIGVSGFSFLITTDQDC